MLSLRSRYWSIALSYLLGAALVFVGFWTVSCASRESVVAQRLDTSPRAAETDDPSFEPLDSYRVVTPIIERTSLDDRGRISDTTVKQLLVEKSESVFLLNAVEGREAIAIVERYEEHPANNDMNVYDHSTFNYSGTLEGRPGSRFYLTLGEHQDGKWSILLTVFDRDLPNYQLRAHSLEEGFEIRANLRTDSPSGACGVEDEGLALFVDRDSPKRTCPSFDWPESPKVTISLLVLYYGKTFDKNLASNAVLQANDILFNSKTNVSFSPVAIEWYEYSTSETIKQAWSNWQNGLDPFRNVENRRVAHKADLVSIIWEKYSSSSICGSDWAGNAEVLTEAYKGEIKKFKPLAKSIVNSKNAVDTFTFAHELFHNLGCGHACHSKVVCAGIRSFCEVGSAYVFSYKKKSYSTVMGKECLNDAAVSERLPYLSCSDLYDNGNRLGIPGVHENARVLTFTAPEVAAFY